MNIIDTLNETYISWCQSQDLPCGQSDGDATDLLNDADLSPEQTNWVRAFIAAWEAAEAFMDTVEFKVETDCMGDWEDCWMEDDKPTRFATRALAQVAIDELIADVKTAVEAGDMSHEYNQDDYRIVEA